MRFILSSALMLSFFLFAPSCGSSRYGDRVKDPFSSSKYQSTKRYWRASGKGQSAKSQVARKKADIDAKSILAGQVNMVLKEVADQYMGQTENVSAGEISEKFESLTRQVVNTQIADLRIIGERTFFNEKENVYTAFIAYEIRKNDMLRYLKRLAEADATTRPALKRQMERMIDEKMKEYE